MLTTAYLHARYAWLLLFPLHLSADWSFNCIPLVEQFHDVRNIASIVLYCIILYAIWSAQPLGILNQLWSSAMLACSHPHARAASVCSHVCMHTPQAEQAGAAVRLARARWRLMVLVGLIIAPFSPASNVLFYVGTFIGERLLYSPSIGFCLLLSELLGAVLLDVSCGQGDSQQRHGNVTVNRDAPAARASRQARAPGARACRLLPQQWCVVLVFVVLLGSYAGRTLLRNPDWWDDQRLFAAALRVCPDSALVQLNVGIVQLRLKHYSAAMHHFK